MTVGRYSLPSPVSICVMSPHQTRSGASAVKSRPTKSGAAGRLPVLGPEAADPPDDGRWVRHGYFTHRTMQRLRTSRSMTSSLLSRLSWAFSRRNRSSSSPCRLVRSLLDGQRRPSSPGWSR